MNKRMAIVGFGNQAKVWAQNLTDSGWQVSILLREQSPHWDLAQSMGFVVENLKQLVEHEHVAVLISDHAMPDFFKDNTFKKNCTLFYAHGSMLVYHFDQLPKHVAHVLLSPKMIADEVRACYLQQHALPCVLDVFYSENKDQSLQDTKTVAQALGCRPQDMLFYDAKTEVHADFFSEQTVLCGGIPKVLMMAVETMVKHGIPKDLAFLECVKELEIFMRLFNTKGFYPTMQGISPSAMQGSAVYVQTLLPDQAMQKSFDQCMQAIVSGDFYQNLQAASKRDLPESQTWKQEMQNSLLNEICQTHLEKNQAKDSHE